MTKTVHPEFRPRLISVRDAAPGVRLFRFASWPGFAFVPGQFLMFHFADDPKTWRAYSLCSAPQAAPDHFEVAVGMVGPFSDRLGRLGAGEERGLVVRGPFGRWTWNGEGHAVLVSGGTGITPFRAMALNGKGKITIYYTAKTENDLLFKDEYDAWRNGGIEVNVRTTRTINGGRFGATEIAKATNDSMKHYYLCGPKSLVEDMKNGFLGAGINEKYIHTEKWGDYTDLF